MEKATPIAPSDQPLPHSPSIARHWSTGPIWARWTVLGERAQRIGVVLAPRHEDVDFYEAGSDRAFHATIAGDHHQLAVVVTDDRWLDQANGPDVGGKLGIGLGRRLGAAGIIGVEL